MPTSSSSIVRRSVLRYLAMSCLVLVVVGVVVAYVVSRLAVGEELQQSQVQTREMADKLVAPLVTDDLRAGEAEAVAELADVLENRMRDGSVTHAVVYDEDGLVLWSDNEAIRSQQVRLEPDVTRLFGTSRVLLDEPGERSHPWSEPGDEELIEVYAGAQGADGKPFVFEAYLPPEFIEADRQLVLGRVLPLVIGAMLLFLVATLPLAVALARRVDRAAAARTALIERSLGAVHDERRRIARILHDGVIQDLSAAGYALSALSREAPEGSEVDLPATSAQALTVSRVVPLLKDDVRQLRTMVGDLMESEVDGNTLRAALGAVQTRGGARFGLEISLDVDQVVDTLSEPLATAVFGVVREGVNNAGVHGGASRVDVVVRRVQPTGSSDVTAADRPRPPGRDLLVVTVTDDGAGPPGADGLSTSPERASGAGQAEDPRDHFGLRLLARQLQNLHGTLSLAVAPSGGAVLTATMPLAATED